MSCQMPVTSRTTLPRVEPVVPPTAWLFLSRDAATLPGMANGSTTTDTANAATPTQQTARRPALSPSRASDFKQCPLLYRFRAVDRLPEPPTKAQVRGTLVHSVLERLFSLPRADRTPGRARELPVPPGRSCRVSGGWSCSRGELRQELNQWLTSAEKLLDSYFKLEDPRVSAPKPVSCTSRPN